MTDTELKDSTNMTQELDSKPLLKLRKICKKYISNKSYVFKLAMDILSKNKDRKWLVVLKKLGDTLTNEARTNISNHDTAKFRANKLLVVKIINANNPKLTKKHIVNAYRDITLDRVEYVVGNIVEPTQDFDHDIENICSYGIHYLKSIEPAYYYREIPANHSGKWIVYDDEGDIQQNGQVINGARTGKWTKWIDSISFEKGYYVNGARVGSWITWHIHGFKISEYTYSGGLLNGKYIRWLPDGKVSSKGFFSNGYMVGPLIIYDQDGYIYKYDRDGKIIPNQDNV